MKKIGYWNCSETKLLYICCPFCGGIIYEDTSDNSGYRGWKDFAEDMIGNSFYCERCEEELEIAIEEDVEDE